jgi:hypothetical protein
VPAPPNGVTSEHVLRGSQKSRDASQQNSDVNVSATTLHGKHPLQKKYTHWISQNGQHRRLI